MSQKSSENPSTRHLLPQKESPTQTSQRNPTLSIASSRPESLIQRKQQALMEQSPQIQKATQYQNQANAHVLQKKSNQTGLPDNLKSGIENLSGLSMNDVNVFYNSDKPAQLQAHAYAQGTDIHLARGQEKHLPHEAWHVVQQKQGRVRPTLQMKGVGINDNSNLEKEADIQGAKAALMPSAVSGDLSVKLSQTPPGSLQPVAQLQKIVPKTINGLTHLVEMTPGGHIYNEDFLENERAEVHFGDLLWVDEDNAWLSRRGIHQEVNAKRDKDGEPNHLWLEAVRLNEKELPADTYVRAEMLREPIKIHVPRKQDGINGAIQYVIEIIDKINMGKPFIEKWKIEGIKSDLIGKVKKRLISSSADAEVKFETIRSVIEEAFTKVSSAFKEEKITREECQLLEGGLHELLEVFDRYSQPKNKHPLGGLIGREELHEFGFVGVDLGGIGLKKNFLDVNVADSTNNPNFMILGDAMALQQSFKPDSVDQVVAELLPLVLMVAEDSKPARIEAIKKVLAGVNYITGNSGTASIQFNDNSGEAAVGEEELLHIAAQYGFKLENNNPRSPYRCFTFQR